jgi:hypothetical protein
VMATDEEAAGRGNPPAEPRDGCTTAARACVATHVHNAPRPVLCAPFASCANRTAEEVRANIECNAMSAVDVTHHFLKRMVRGGQAGARGAQGLLLAAQGKPPCDSVWLLPGTLSNTPPPHTHTHTAPP